MNLKTVVPMTDERRNELTNSRIFEGQILAYLASLKAKDGIDQRWLSITITAFEKAFMFLNRAICNGGRTENQDPPAAA